MAGNSATLAAIKTAHAGRAGHPTGGVASFSGNGVTLAFNIAHGQGAVPNHWWALPVSEPATAKRTVTVTATNVVLTFAVAPPSGSSNIQVRWGASKL